MTRKLMVVAVCVMALALVGCAAFDVESLQASLDQTQRVVEAASVELVKAKADLAEAKAEAEALPEGKDRDEKLAEIEVVADYAAKIEKAVARGEVIVAQIRSAMENAQDPSEIVALAGAGIAPLVPPPWGIVVTAATGIAAVILREMMNRKKVQAALAETGNVLDLVAPAIKGTQALRDSDPKFKAAHSAAVRNAVADAPVSEAEVRALVDDIKSAV